MVLPILEASIHIEILSLSLRYTGTHTHSLPHTHICVCRCMHNFHTNPPTHVDIIPRHIPKIHVTLATHTCYQHEHASCTYAHILPCLHRPNLLQKEAIIKKYISVFTLNSLRHCYHKKYMFFFLITWKKILSKDI